MKNETAVVPTYSCPRLNPDSHGLKHIRKGNRFQKNRRICSRNSPRKEIPSKESLFSSFQNFRFYIEESRKVEHINL
ncbi:hypothetical protein CH380_08695 [Leptospira adleri]|uniref:Uncharacterized protein n=1 Tax=Leptospira adleri TaxID=2023186 RepID=A0A2M9YQ58_9LEPT|nr:hypothetical protein CH380_08695 [Leptospira adleri]PJZ60731.1 hypothetical protein CH376_17080 [Leptospira adleri]